MRSRKFFKHTIFVDDLILAVRRLLWIALLGIVWLLPRDAAAINLHRIDSNDQGFALYRSGVPWPKDIKQWCAIGINEVMVLSGDAQSREFKFKDVCPQIKVIYNKQQNVRVSLDKEFLKVFDDWVLGAKCENKKILFRCQCGCHRTGRLAAYYEMKHMNYPAWRSIKRLHRFGKNIDQFPFLQPQIRALWDYANGRPCRFRGDPRTKRHCVR